MKRLFFAAFLLLGSCATERQVPTLLRPPNPDSLTKLAALPPYLVPPPAQATAKEVEKWTAAQTQALANVNAPVGKVKLKNVGNPETTTTVQHGVTGQQITTGVVILGVVALLLFFGPRILRGGL